MHRNPSDPRPVEVLKWLKVHPCTWIYVGAALLIGFVLGVLVR